MRGLILPWNVEGKANVQGSSRLVSAPPGCITAPADKSWVKLYHWHRKPDGSGIAIGYLDELVSTELGLVGVFNLGTSEAAIKALRAMRERTEDGLSVELEPLTMKPGGREIEHGRLDGVALVPRPAFLPARVEEIWEAA